MSDNVQEMESVVESAADSVVEVPAAAPQPGVGEVLREAREARQMSVADAAQLLKISFRQVEALESDNWNALPGQTFVRGFVRNYARLLHLEAEPLLARIKAEQTPEDPNIVLPQTTSASLPQPGYGKRRDLAVVAGAALMVAVAVAAYIVVPADFWQSPAKTEVTDVASDPAKAEDKATEPVFPPASATNDGAAANEAPNVPLTPPAAAPVNAPVVPAPAAPAPQPAAPAAAVAPAAAAAPVAGQSRFKLRFEQPSWVEVKDKNGQIIFSQLNPTGSEREVEGLPPFVLVVGNASHVKVTYKGREVSLEPRSKDDVARVTLD